jgi:hypothetical protein
MKKALYALSILFVAAAVVGLACTRLPASRTAAADDLFGEFPVDVPKTIHFSGAVDSDDDGKPARDREREILDQVRDWCLLTVISSSGLTPRAIAESVYDLPAVRHEDMRRVANFEYGETRSRMLNETDVVAVIPASTEEVRRDNLAHIVDEQRKNLGHKPHELLVFEYSLDLAHHSATITRRKPVSGTDVFTPAYGYQEIEVTNLDQFNHFLGSIDDLTYASKQRGKLVLAGRHYLRPLGPQDQPWGHIGAEEVAAIWRGQQGLAEYQGCGFSLDPHVDFGAVSKSFDSDFAPLLNRIDPAITLQARAAMNEKADEPEQREQKEAHFINTLSAACSMSSSAEKECLEGISELIWDHSFQAARYEGKGVAGTEVGMVLFYTDLIMKLWSFDLAGSAPGHSGVAGFPIKTAMRVPPIFKSELDRAPATRLWLGPLNSGFQVADQRHSLLFARNSTRVFARPHNFLTNQDQTDILEPNIYNRTFINWWNDHYEEIARYEPQYERLNQIVKWSIVISWLDLDRNDKLLGFLAQDAPQPVTVRRDHYFEQWAKAHPEARFTDWNKIHFDSQADARGENESLPILRSELFPAFGTVMGWKGGVSLASRNAVEEAAVAAERLDALPPTARRAGVDALRSDLAAGRLRTVTATEYNFKPIVDEAMSVLAKPRPGVRLSDTYGAFENAGFNRTIRSSSDGLLMRTQIQTDHVLGDFGDLRIVKNQRGFDVAWESREIDLGQSLARRLSTARDPMQVLTADSRVESMVNIDGGQVWIIKVRGSDRWIKFSRATSSDTEIPKGFHARVAGFGDDAQAVDVAWLDGPGMRAELPDVGYIEIVPADARNTGEALHCCSRTPPAGAQQTVLTRDGAQIAGLRDTAGNSYFRLSDLPAAVRANPSRLFPRLLSSDELQLLQSMNSGEYRELANQLAKDPAQFRAGMNHILDEELGYNRLLMQRQQFAQAMAHMDDLINIHGHLPELTYHRALLQVASNDADGASAALNATFRRPISNQKQFFDEVDYRIQIARTPDEARSAARIGEFAAWNQLPNRSGEVVAIVKNGRLELALNTNHLPKGRALSAAEADVALGRSKTLYLADSPLTSNLDPAIPFQQASLRQLIATGKVTIHELRMADVSQFHPVSLQEVATGKSWHLPGDVGAWRPTVRGTEHLFHSHSCDDRNDPECNHVYLVTPTEQITTTAAM